MNRIKNLYLITVICLFLGFYCDAQQSQEDLLMRKWYVCDTNFNLSVTKIIHLAISETDCLISSKKNVNLEFQQNGEYKLHEFHESTNNAIAVGIGDRILSGEFRFENNQIWFAGNKYTIELLDKQMLILRRD